VASKDDPAARPAPGSDDAFQYVVALIGDDGLAHRILSRAGTESLAAAMYAAACGEFPGRRVVLIRDGRVIRASDDS
jgi:hypothetical protein